MGRTFDATLGFPGEGWPSQAQRARMISFIGSGFWLLQSLRDAAKNNRFQVKFWKKEVVRRRRDYEVIQERLDTATRTMREEVAQNLFWRGLICRAPLHPALDLVRERHFDDFDAWDDVHRAVDMLLAGSVDVGGKARLECVVPLLS